MENADHTFPCPSSTGSARLESPPSGERYVNKAHGDSAPDHGTFRKPRIPALVLQPDFNKKPLVAKIVARSMPPSLAERITSYDESILKWNMETERNRKLKEEVPRNYKVQMRRENSYVGPRNMETAGAGDSRDYKPNEIGLPHTRQTHVETLRKFDQPNNFISPPMIELDKWKIMRFEPNEAKDDAGPPTDADQMPIKSHAKVAKKTAAVQSGSDVSSCKFSYNGSTSTKDSSSRKPVFRRVQSAVVESPRKSLEPNAAAPVIEKLIYTSGLGSELAEDEAVDGFGVDFAKDKASNTSEDVRKKLKGVYDEVIVVDNILMAREIVQKLTQQYRHLIHACDTEVCMVLQ